MPLGARWRDGAAARQGQSHAVAMSTLPSLIQSASGVLGRALVRGRGAAGHARRDAGQRGHCPDEIFPVPCLTRVAVSEWARELGVPKSMVELCWCWADLFITIHNCMFAGEGTFGVGPPSAAQRRVQRVQLHAAFQFFGCGVPYPETDTILAATRSRLDFYGAGGPTLPLSNRGGVPAVAGNVDLHEVLAEHFPHEARCVNEPRAILLPPRLRPEKLPRPYVKLAADYPSFVARCVDAGLMDVVPQSQVWKHRGAPLYAGAFAVKKDADEDRVILAAVPVNHLLRGDRVPRPRFGYPPRLRGLRTRPGVRMVKYKRDARHYFFQLRLPMRWRKYLAWPPLKSDGRVLLYPRSICVPMGFAPSAGWAQRVTDRATEGLPADRQVRFDLAVPEDWPVWGSIVDDVWAIAEEPGTGSVVSPSCPLRTAAGRRPHAMDADDQPMPDDLQCPRDWIRHVEQKWSDIGVELNVKKNVDAAEAEIQGATLHPLDHWLGVSVERRVVVMAAVLEVIGSRCLGLSQVEALVGRLQYCLSFQPCLRCLLSSVYDWIALLRSSGRKAAVLPQRAREELFLAALVLPLACANLDAPWCRRVECYDACPGGHGRAYTDLDEDLVSKAARWSEAKVGITDLSSPYGLDLDDAGRCCLRRITLPDGMWWKEIHRPGGHSHITLEEAEAAIWSLLCRLRRPAEVGARCLQGGDNAPQVAAFMKGRSSSKALNGKCRRACAVVMAGALLPFHFWMPSAKNPADRPSRKHLSPLGFAASHDMEQPLPAEDVLLPPPSPFGQSGLMALALCSGPARPDDWCACMVQLGAAVGILIVALRVDPCISSRCDLLQDSFVCELQCLIKQRQVIAVCSSPPCSTLSRARHVPRGPHSPRPIRSRDNVWWPLPYCSAKEIRSVLVGSILSLTCFSLILRAARVGAPVIHENPADPGKHPYPSVFASFESVWLRNVAGMCLVSTDQCMFGALYRKPTMLLTTCREEGLEKTCCHNSHAVALGGRLAQGGWRTAATAQYPPAFSRALADACATSLAVTSWQLSDASGPCAGPWESRLLPALRLALANAGPLQCSGSRLQL